MKKIILTAALLVSCLMFKAEAQVSFSLGINIGSQPEWGPVGYDHASYYYMPDYDVYYDVPNHQYVYLENNVWIRRTVLPARYHFDPYNSYKVVINDDRPWRRATVYRTKYATYKGRRDQVVIRDSKEVKYKEHWNGNNGRGPGNRGNGRGPDKHDDRGRGPQGHDNGHGNDKGHGGGNGRGGEHGNDHGHH